jgi:Zn-dependent M28 family amino/carboxypeptidase
LGRRVGEPGQKLAAEFLKSYYQNEDIKSPFGNSNYYQTIPSSFFSGNYGSSENVLAYIKGSEYPEDVIIISSHLDHLGVTEDGKINNGADDDGSGTVALMEMAQAFKLATDAGHTPKRSILFLHLTAEEIGKRGSEYYTKHPIFPLENTIANLNIDMIGRVDEIHENNKNYLYLIGSDRLSKELHYLSEKINNSFYNIHLDYRYNIEGDVNDYYSRSDHYNFAYHNIPVIFYFNGEHDDYHEDTDTPDKINYGLLEKRTRLIFATAWQIANQNHRLAIDANHELLK